MLLVKGTRVRVRIPTDPFYDDITGVVDDEHSNRAELAYWVNLENPKGGMSPRGPFYRKHLIPIPALSALEQEVCAYISRELAS